MKYYVYIIFSQSVDRYYTGYTVDLSERRIEHNLGPTPSIRQGRPWLLAYTEEFDNKSSAIRREREIKSKKSHKFLETLIKSQSVDSSVPIIDLEGREIPYFIGAGYS